MGKKNHKPAAKGNAASSSRYLDYMVLLLVLFCVSYIRIRLRAAPLERDEGEYAYAGQLLLQRIPPYKLAFNMKLPGTYGAYAVIMSLLGQTPTGIHLGLLLVNLATIVLVFLLALRLSGRHAALAAASTYALLSLHPAMLGFAAHANHFVVLAACAATLALLEAIQRGKLWLIFCGGVLYGIAFLMKQPGASFILFASYYLITTEPHPVANWKNLGKKLAVLSFGAILPFAFTCFALWRAGVFPSFWFWTFSYAYQYATKGDLDQRLRDFQNALDVVILPTIGIWIIAASGLTALIWDRASRPQARFVLGFLGFSALAVCPGFLFREHYFILLLPALSLLVGIAVSACSRWIANARPNPLAVAIPSAILAMILANLIYSRKDFFFQLEPSAAIRSVYGGNPFPEEIPVADYIRQHSSDSSRVAVIGSEPAIYFYAHRHSATGYIYTYALMEEQKYAAQMQQEMIYEIVAAAPEYLVFIACPSSWLATPHSDQNIFSWFQQYERDHYELRGVADILPTGTEYRWDQAAMSYRPQGLSVVYVFRRRP